MSEYMGDDHAIALQKVIRSRADEIAANPLLANGGRVLNILDPVTYGWDNVRYDAKRGGFVVLTMVDRDITLSQLAEEFGEDMVFPYWDTFTGSPDEALPACEAVVSEIALPDGWITINQTYPDDKTIHETQLLNKATGVAPTPAYFLRGDQMPSMLTYIRDNEGNLAACASGSMRYHIESPLAGWFFAGAVSVSPAHRRIGLGSYVNAKLLVESQKALAWSSVLEQAKADNAPSVGMIKRCGLRQNSDKVTILINTSERYITR